MTISSAEAMLCETAAKGGKQELAGFSNVVVLGQSFGSGSECLYLAGHILAR
jgi:hypothetical protein